MVPTSVAIKSYRWGFFDLLIHNLRKTSAYCYFQLIFLFLFHLSVILVSPLCHSRENGNPVCNLWIPHQVRDDKGCVIPAPPSVIPVKTGIQSGLDPQSS